MKVFVTGHRGYIGSHVVDVLKQEGHTVIGCDLGLFEGCNWEPIVQPDRQFLKDVRQVEARDLDGCDSVMHLAAISNDPMGDQCPNHLRRQSRCFHPPGPDCQASRRSPLPLRRELLGLRPGREARSR